MGDFSQISAGKVGSKEGFSEKHSVLALSCKEPRKFLQNRERYSAYNWF
jgi:hypothetical protein